MRERAQAWQYPYGPFRAAAVVVGVANCCSLARGTGARPTRPCVQAHFALLLRLPFCEFAREIRASPFLVIALRYYRRVRKTLIERGMQL